MIGQLREILAFVSVSQFVFPIGNIFSILKISLTFI